VATRCAVARVATACPQVGVLLPRLTTMVETTEASAASGCAPCKQPWCCRHFLLPPPWPPLKPRRRRWCGWHASLAELSVRRHYMRATCVDTGATERGGGVIPQSALAAATAKRGRVHGRVAIAALWRLSRLCDRWSSSPVLPHANLGDGSFCGSAVRGRRRRPRWPALLHEEAVDSIFVYRTAAQALPWPLLRHGALVWPPCGK